MKGQLSVQSMLILLLALSIAAGFFVYMVKLSTGSLSQTEKLRVYPEVPPQILSTQCYTDHGYIAVDSDGLSGDLLYTVENLNGTRVKTGVVNVNITDYGGFYFSALMEHGNSYSVRLYTPKWSITDVCTPKYDGGLIFYLPLDEGYGLTVSDDLSDETGTLIGNLSGDIVGATRVSGHLGGALSFDGADDYVSIPDSLNLNITDGITLSAWVNVGGESQNKFPEPDAQFETGSFSNGFSTYTQTNSSAEVVDWEKYGGTYSARFHRDGYEAYPGKCYSGANESYKCSWNSTHCICTNSNYTVGQNFGAGDTNTVMWGGIKFGTGTGATSAETRLGLEADHFYILSYYFKKNITTTGTYTYVCANMGWCNMGMGWPTLNVGNIPAGTYGDWTKLEKSLFTPANMFSDCGGATCLREFILVQHTYVTVPEGEDIFVDDVQLVESNVLRKAGAYGLSVDVDTIYGTINDQVVSANLMSGWNYISLTYDKNQISLYVNGSLIDSAGYSTPINVVSEPLFIGNFINGTLDDVRVYDRALNTTEIQQLYQDQDVRKSLIGYWPFDGISTTVARDSHMWAPGKRGASLYFNGVTDYAIVPDSDTLDLTTAWTIGMWFNKYGSSFSLLTKDGVGFDPTGAYGIYAFDDLSIKYETNNIDSLQSTAGTFSLDDWYHLMISFDNSTNPRMTIYVDGQEVKTGNPTAPSALDKNLLIGRRGVGSLFKGLIDEISIYDRPLTADEVFAIYSSYQKG
ncbi:MAG: LamG domain-containing protein [Candidatus Altiarchaeota archaeon]|nr:LamG domain-containing protein [Candidatus Altiarchaeota archaeon]